MQNAGKPEERDAKNRIGTLKAEADKEKQSPMRNNGKPTGHFHLPRSSRLTPTLGKRVWTKGTNYTRSREKKKYHHGKKERPDVRETPGLR